MSCDYQKLCLRPTKNQRFLALTSVGLGLECENLKRTHGSNGNMEGVGMLS